MNIYRTLFILFRIMNNWNFSVTKKGFSSEEQESEFLKRSKYLSEFKSQEEKDEAVRNLGLDGTKHIILSKDEFDQLTEYVQDAIYFVTE